MQHYGPQTVHTASFFTIWSAHCPGHRFAPITANKEKLNEKSAAGFQLKSHEIALKDTKDIVITGVEDSLVGEDSDLIYLLIAYGDAGDHEWPNGKIIIVQFSFRTYCNFNVFTISTIYVQ